MTGTTTTTDDIKKQSSMVERAPSKASSVRTVHSTNRQQTTSRIYLGDSPPIDMEKCRSQLQLENVVMPEKVDPEMMGKPDEYFDGRNEECFVLDSFNALIQQSRNGKKDFLLARVMTVDPTDPTRTYWSYYSAHQINKVLFRTQPDQDMLHRMRCRNPLNNMLIVGNVHYFSISPEEVDRAHKEYEEQTGDKVKVLTRSANLSSSSTNLLDVDRRTYPLPVLAKSMDNLTNADLPEQATLIAPTPQANIAGQPAVLPTKSTTWVSYKAKYIGCDDDFLQRKNFREIFLQNAISPGDAELFPLNSTTVQPVRVMVNGQPVVVQVTREPIPPASWSNLGGMIYWPPRDSVLIRSTGVLNEWSFAVIALVTIGLTVGLGLAILPLWGLIVGGPVAAAALALTAFTMVHFRE